MRPVPAFCLRYSVKVRDDDLVSCALAYGLGMIADSVLVCHVPMAEKRIPVLPPPLLEIVINHCAPHRFCPVGDLRHHTGCQCGHNGPW
jgi:hypothetical protein